MEIFEAINKRFRFRSQSDNLPWSSPRGTRTTLAQLFGDLGYETGVEIGTRAGGYSKCLCENAPKLHLFCVDPWMAYGRLDQDRQDKFYQEAVRNLSKYNVTIMRKTSMDALADFKDWSLDFVFIDGNHQFDYVCMDLICWAKKVKPGGIVALHDYLNFHMAGVVKAVDAYTHCHRINPWFVTKEIESTAFWVNPDERERSRRVLKRK